MINHVNDEEISHDMLESHHQIICLSLMVQNFRVVFVWKLAIVFANSASVQFAPVWYGRLSWVSHSLVHQVRIKCWDYIKKIAIYQESVAVQLRNKIIVYELDKGKTSESPYRISSRINHTLDCNLLVLTSKHITLCQVAQITFQDGDPWVAL